MKSFTVHKLDDETAGRLEEKARREGTSVNKMAKKLLRQALGMGDRPGPDRRADFAGFLGTWSEQDAAELEEAVRVFEQIDDEAWR